MGIRFLGNKFCYSLLVGIIIPTTCFAQTSLKGNWKGELTISPTNTLSLGFNIGSEQEHNITMDSPNQGVFGLPCSVTYQSNDSINLSIEKIGLAYQAKLQSDKLVGELTQQGYTFPLILERGTIEVNRPQTPKPPFDYDITNISITNKDANATLCGTFTAPHNFSKTTPIVVMVSGSGLQNRDEEIFYHKPFAVMADFFARNGIASFRYDDRGFGDSTGDGLSATTADFASDAATVLHQLKKQYKNNRIGILGHSEGGQIAFMLAGSNKHKAKPDYIVTLGAPALPGDSILAEQSVIYLRSAGIDSIACEDYRKAVLKLYAVMKTKGIEAAQKTIPSICPGWDFLPQYAAMKANINAITENTTPWLLYSISYSPASDIRAAKCHMLVLYGNKDTQVPSNLNAQIVTNLNPQAQVESFNGLNHLMQHCITGNVNEYGKIQETIAPEVMDRIANFIHSINTK